MTPGEKVRDLREELNISVQELAKASNMRPKYLLQIEENMIERVNTLTWQKLADALSVPLAVVMGTEEYSPKQSVYEEMPEGESFVMKLIMNFALVAGVLVIIVTLFGAGAVLFFVAKTYLID